MSDQFHNPSGSAVPRRQRKPGRWKWLRNAFAVDDSKNFDPPEEQKQLVDRLCRWLVARRMNTPVLVFLESSRGLNYIGAHMLYFFRPLVAALFNTRQYHQFAQFLEHRGSIDYLLRRIEHYEAEDLRRTHGQSDHIDGRNSTEKP